MEISDDDFVHSVSKRRKSNSSKKKGEQSRKVENSGMEGDGEGYMDGIIEEEVEGNEFSFDFFGVVEEMRKRKKNKKKEDRPILMWAVLEQENERWVAENLAKDIDLSNQNDMVDETVDPPSDLIMPLLRFPIIKGTLVICPLVAVLQWVSEIDHFTSKGSMKLKIHLKYFCGPRAERTDKQSKQKRKDYKQKKTSDSVVETKKRTIVDGLWVNMLLRLMLLVVFVCMSGNSRCGPVNCNVACEIILI
ncbi:unnamed protein product [Fraxinus pennsylvanica]|uniref:Uncharacterized protein n=1 Tax=Fraxinus pennsylvanica TaxID=56036 RepID=A0AAD2EDA6_9LAMI|nr:unnamed protein product [Fraxinus pennsylvanica]